MFGFKTSMEESLDLSEYETYKLNEIDVGVKFTGQPVAIRFEPDEYEEKNYTSMRLQLQNHEDKQILNCYCNLPLSYPVVRKLFRTNNFYKSSFDFIESVMGLIDIDNILDSEGNPIKCIEEINIEEFIKYVNELEKVTIEVTENGDYNSFKVVYIENKKEE